MPETINFATPSTGQLVITFGGGKQLHFECTALCEALPESLADDESLERTVRSKLDSRVTETYQHALGVIEDSEDEVLMAFLALCVQYYRERHSALADA
ncbi:hypothetical protein GW756_02450 [bacterium]|nr:hypothetical protein [bacterium]NCQ55654.1 hypothetical protein [Candidatus Parcubacteria bacterium]NCS67479.1 hypothetical protein [Candidatus Peregrinibacteria bacterium]NCS96205.1 hypothetical protein [bacterium]